MVPACSSLAGKQPPTAVPRHPLNSHRRNKFPLKQVLSVSADAPAQQPPPATPNPHQGTVQGKCHKLNAHACNRMCLLLHTHSALPTAMFGGHMRACPQLCAEHSTLDLQSGSLSRAGCERTESTHTPDCEVPLVGPRHVCRCHFVGVRAGSCAGLQQCMPSGCTGTSSHVLLW